MVITRSARTAASRCALACVLAGASFGGMGSAAASPLVQDEVVSAPSGEETAAFEAVVGTTTTIPAPEPSPSPSAESATEPSPSPAAESPPTGTATTEPGADAPSPGPITGDAAAPGDEVDPALAGDGSVAEGGATGSTDDPVTGESPEPAADARATDDFAPDEPSPDILPIPEDEAELLSVPSSGTIQSASNVDQLQVPKKTTDDDMQEPAGAPTSDPGVTPPGEDTSTGVVSALPAEITPVHETTGAGESFEKIDCTEPGAADLSECRLARELDPAEVGVATPVTEVVNAQWDLDEVRSRDTQDEDFLLDVGEGREVQSFRSLTLVLAPPAPDTQARAVEQVVLSFEGMTPTGESTEKKLVVDTRSLCTGGFEAFAFRIPVEGNLDDLGKITRVTMGAGDATTERFRLSQGTATPEDLGADVEAAVGVGHEAYGVREVSDRLERLRDTDRVGYTHLGAQFESATVTPAAPMPTLPPLDHEGTLPTAPTTPPEGDAGTGTGTDDVVTPPDAPGPNPTEGEVAAIPARGPETSAVRLPDRSIVSVPSSRPADTLTPQDLAPRPALETPGTEAGSVQAPRAVPADGEGGALTPGVVPTPEPSPRLDAVSYGPAALTADKVAVLQALGVSLALIGSLALITAEERRRKR